MECPGCQAANREGRRFCADCGHPLTRPCRACGYTNEPGEKFCGGCGELVETDPALTGEREGERKQVTVLFADVVGFTSLSEALDPETVHEIMDGCYELLTREVERFEGHVNAFTGDGVMALFGAPIAHEDHAVRSVHAAERIQQGLERYGKDVQDRWGVLFRMRLGLNTGVVVAGTVGAELRTEYTALGDTINVAARLQRAAPPGAVWAGESTYRAAGNGFAWQPVGRVTVKGKAQPVPAYELRGGRNVGGRFDTVAPRGLTRFVGREADLDQLLAAWERAQTGHGQVISVVGEAGLGKSRLLHEFKQILRERQAALYEGSCFAYGDVVSYLPFLEMLKAMVGWEPSAPGAGPRQAVDNHLAGLSAELAPAAPYLHLLLGVSEAEEMLSQVDTGVVRQRTVKALKDLALAETAVRPLALVVEDVHWIDKASEEVLSAVVDAMEDVPLLIVLLYRPEYLHAWTGKAYHAEISLNRLRGASSAAMVRAILSKSYAESVSLGQLSPEQSQSLVRDLLGTDDIPPDLERLIATQTDGNPLFIEELTHSLIESGDLLRTDDGYAFTRAPETLVLPHTVQDVLLARVDRLNPELKSLLQVASVLGRVFSYALLGAVARQDTALDDALLQLADLDFIYPAGLAPEPQYSFKHVLAQEAVYQTLLRTRRETYHERAAEALEALYPERLEEFYELLAYHYARSANADKAVEYLDRASQKAARANAMAESRRHFNEAMELLDGMPEIAANQHRRISLLAHQFLVFFLLFRLPEWFDLAKRHEAVAEELDDRAVLGLFLKGLGHCQWLFGDIGDAVMTLRRSIEACEASKNHSGAGMAFCLAEWSHWSLGNYDDAISMQTKALEALELDFDLRHYMWACAAAGWSYAQRGRWQEAVEQCEEGLRAGDEYHDDSVTSFSALILANARADQGAMELALEAAELSARKAQTPADEIWAQSFLSLVWARTGQPDRAAETLARVVPIFAETRFFIGEMYAGVFLGEAYWRAGQAEEADRALRSVAERAERSGMRFYAGAAHRLLGEVARQAHPEPDGWARAAWHFEQSMAVLGDIGAENELALAQAGYGRLCRDRGDLDRARAYLTGALATFERLGTQLEPERTRQTVAEIAGR